MANKYENVLADNQPRAEILERAAQTVAEAATALREQKHGYTQSLLSMHETRQRHEQYLREVYVGEDGRGAQVDTGGLALAKAIECNEQGDLVYRNHTLSNSRLVITEVETPRFNPDIETPEEFMQKPDILTAHDESGESFQIPLYDEVVVELLD